MENFQSQALNRDFPLICFVSHFAPPGRAAARGGDASAPPLVSAHAAGQGGAANPPPDTAAAGTTAVHSMKGMSASFTWLTWKSSQTAGSVVAPSEAMFAAFDIPLSWGHVLKRTVKETGEDDCLGLVAQLAYHFFLALFPAVLFVLVVASFSSLTNFIDDIVGALRPIALAEVIGFLEEQLKRVSNADIGGILTIGIVGAIWSSSAAVVAIIGSRECPFLGRVRWTRLLQQVQDAALRHAICGSPPPHRRSSTTRWRPMVRHARTRKSSANHE
jgi:hypothetical protein